MDGTTRISTSRPALMTAGWISLVQGLLLLVAESHASAAHRFEGRVARG